MSQRNVGENNEHSMTSLNIYIIWVNFEPLYHRHTAGFYNCEATCSRIIFPVNLDATEMPSLIIYFLLWQMDSS